MCDRREGRWIITGKRNHRHRRLPYPGCSYSPVLFRKVNSNACGFSRNGAMRTASGSWVKFLPKKMYQGLLSSLLFLKRTLCSLLPVEVNSLNSFLLGFAFTYVQRGVCKCYVLINWFLWKVCFLQKIFPVFSEKSCQPALLATGKGWVMGRHLSNMRPSSCTVFV